MKKLSFKNFKNRLNNNIFSKVNKSKVCFEGYITTQGFTKSMRESYEWRGSDGGEVLYLGLISNKKYLNYDKFHVYNGHHMILKFFEFNLSKKNFDKYEGLLNRYGFSFFYNKPIIYLGTSLRDLLKNTKYENYIGKIQVYGIYRGLSTTKSHIGRIWKAEILNDEGNIVDVFESKKMKEFVDNHERYID